MRTENFSESKVLCLDGSKEVLRVIERCTILVIFRLPKTDHWTLPVANENWCEQNDSFRTGRAGFVLTFEQVCLCEKRKSCISRWWKSFWNIQLSERINRAYDTHGKSNIYPTPIMSSLGIYSSQFLWHSVMPIKNTPESIRSADLQGGGNGGNRTLTGAMPDGF